MKLQGKKNQPPTGNTSSLTLILQMFIKASEKKKEAENKESAEESIKVRCNTCFKEIFPKRQCGGHGKGKGSGDSDSSENSSEENANPNVNNGLTLPEIELKPGEEWAVELSLSAMDLEPELVQELVDDLIALGLLLVETTLESKTITLKLLCDPNDLSEEQSEELDKLIQAISNLFLEFQKQHQLSSGCINIIQNENGNTRFLRITLPTLELYSVFIQQLANQLAPLSNLKVPAMKPNLSENASAAEVLEHEQEQEQEQRIFNPSPFNMNPW